MPTINFLATVDSIQAGDQLPLYSQGNGDARKASFTTLMQFIQDNLTTLSAMSVSGRLSAGYLSRGAPVTKTASFALGNAENWVICNGGVANVTVSLPNAADWIGREVMLKNVSATNTVISSASNVVPLAGGAASTAILSASGWATLVSDGTNWVVMQGS